jgi:2-polyprenyl-6-methoxyphenol hydroxylase-like FAD-dependent oxidoreductase
MSLSGRSFHVLIIGAGTGGLCLAHGLKRAGIGVAVYERDRTRTDGLQGYRVGISPGGSRALHECLPPELYSTFVATCARAPRYFNILTERLSELLSIEVPPDDDPIDSEKSVSRMTLRQVLLTGLEDVVHFDKKFARYEQKPDGTVTAFFEDGSSATGDLLVGADGAGSRVRKQLLPHAEMEDTGIASIGAKVPLTPETRRLLPPKVFKGVTLINAPKGYGAILHMMEFKWDRAGVKDGIGGNDADLIARWPGLLYDNTTDYIMWGFWASRRKYPVDPSRTSREDLVRLALGMTTGWHPNVRRLIELSDLSTVFPINIRTSVPVVPWPSGNVTLLGDAIHTMTPGRGVGANTALRDAALLCRNLTAARDGTMPLTRAVRDYEAAMIEYGFEAVLESRKQMDGDGLIHRPVVGRVALAAMRTGMRIVNAVPPLKRRMAESQRRFRGGDRDPSLAGPAAPHRPSARHHRARRAARTHPTAPEDRGGRRTS